MKMFIAQIRKHYGGFILLIAILFIAMWFPNRAVNRYAIGVDTNGDILILDTRTGHAWLRKKRYVVIDLGTIDKPKYDCIKTKGDIFDQISQ